MARRSLRPHLNQIRSWVRQGRTDAWVAHQLEVTVQDIEQFKRQNDLLGDESPTEGVAAVAYPEEIDLRAEDDELIAAELEAAQEAEKAKAEAEAAAKEARRRGRGGARPSPPQEPSRTPLRSARGRAAGGHVRPRRRGLRPVARPRHPGQPGLRGALGGPPPGRGHGRGGPDSDPPHRRRLSE